MPTRFPFALTAVLLGLLVAGPLAQTGPPEEDELWGPAAAGPPAGRLVDEGYLAIFFRGTEVGYEQYWLYRDTDGSMTMDTDSLMHLPRGAGNAVFQFRTRERMDARYNSLAFEEIFRINGEESFIRVALDTHKAQDTAFMAGRAHNRTTDISPERRILEEANYSLYLPLIRKYRLGKGGEQTLRAYIPKVAVEVAAKISPAGESIVDTPSGPVRLHRYVVDVGGFQGVSLAVNEADQLVELSVPRQEIELRRDLAAVAPPGRRE